MNSPFAVDLGLRVGPLNPYIGFAGLRLGMGEKINSESWQDYYNNGNTDNLYLYRNEKSEGDASITVLIPAAGMRLYLGEGTVEPYVFASVFKAFTSIEILGDWTTRYYDTDGEMTSETKIEADEEKLISTYREFENGSVTYKRKYDFTEELNAVERFLSPIGGVAGIGVGYRISESLYIFGEFAVQGVIFETEYNDTNSDNYDDDDRADWKHVIESELSVHFGITKTSLGLRIGL